jgi:hypothetical protein
MQDGSSFFAKPIARDQPQLMGFAKGSTHPTPRYPSHAFDAVKPEILRLSRASYLVLILYAREKPDADSGVMKRWRIPIGIR